MSILFYIISLQERLKLWDTLKEQYNNELANKILEPITITFPDGKTTTAMAWKSTPYDVAIKIRF